MQRELSFDCATSEFNSSPRSLHCLFRTSGLEAVFLKPGILLTTYGMVQHNADIFCKNPLSKDDGVMEEGGPIWDIVFLDEVFIFRRPVVHG